MAAKLTGTCFCGRARQWPWITCGGASCAGNETAQTVRRNARERRLNRSQHQGGTDG